MAAFDSLTRPFGSLEVNGSTINKDNEHAGCSQRVKEFMNEGNDIPADAPGKSLDEVYSCERVCTLMTMWMGLKNSRRPSCHPVKHYTIPSPVDFEYLKERHDYHNGYSLAPETVQLNKVKIPRRQTEVCCILRQPKTVLTLRLKIRKPHGYKFKPDHMAEDLYRSHHRAQSRCHH
ncbi:unnamed protein product [Mytilus edulis]|uniref:Uncharacterized protein n=1 Tax=Mytilus edulis TaxID=6550 RepID=A0A8S3QVE8_MYTED|nr:unnamed protein product [Mytilus edulis]